MSRVNSALVRRVNTARVFHALRENPGTSQRGLCALTGLDASTVSTVVGGLQAEGAVRDDGGPRRGTAGRPQRPLSIDPAGGLLIGAAIETDGIRLMAAGLDGVPVDTLTLPPAPRVDDALGALRVGVGALLARLGAPIRLVRGIGVGQHGLMRRDGHLVLAPRMGWRDVPMASRLRALFDVPVRVENDTKLAALAEHLFGACRGVPDFVLIHGGSGVGGALHLDGALYHGAGLGGELGHMKVVPRGLPCGCGGHGCLEAYVADAAIAARLAAPGAERDQVLDEAGWTLGLAMANLANILNPRRIVLAGSLARDAEALLPRARAALLENALPMIGEQLEVVVSTLGEGAVELGGVGLALDGYLPLRPGWGAPSGRPPVETTSPA